MKAVLAPIKRTILRNVSMKIDEGGEGGGVVE